MTIHRILLTAGALLLAGATISQAATYIGGSFTYGNLGNTSGTAGTIRWDNATMINGHVGQKIDFFRGELELGYTKWEANERRTGAEAEVELMPLMFNVYADLPVNRHVEFFAGAGLGMGFVLGFDVDGRDQDPDAIVWGFQAKAGMSYNVMNNLALFTNVRLLGFTDFKLGDGRKIESPVYTAFELGARYVF